MIIDGVITRDCKPKRKIEHEAWELLKRWPGAKRVVLAHRGPRGSVHPQHDEIVLMYGGYKPSKIRIGTNVGLAFSDLRKNQKRAGRLELERRALIGPVASWMAQNSRIEALASLHACLDALLEIGLHMLDLSDVVDIVKDAVYYFELEVTPSS